MYLAAFLDFSCFRRPFTIKKIILHWIILNETIEYKY